MNFSITVLFLFCLQGLSAEDPHYSFKDEFSFGVATSAYQIEGAWNVSGKGVSFWDFITHTSHTIVDGSNGDVACDSYHKLKNDIDLLKGLGVKHYRFSIAWTRILPTGFNTEVNQDGVDYYNELINRLIEANIEPWVTIYHFDHPYSFHLLGGWFQPKIVDYLTDYADVLFELFGDRVKTWITINEPWSICVSGVVGLSEYIPAGYAEYICGQNVLKAHASIWNLYNKKYRAKQQGKLSMAFNMQAYLSATNKTEDIEAAERVNQFVFGWFVHPLVYGNYPDIMIKTIANYSQEQGFNHSRLPPLTLIDLIELKGAYDFIGINIYDTFYVSNNNSVVDPIPSYSNDYGANIFEPEWNTSYSIKMKVKGFGTVLKWIKSNYDNPEIRITEQGYPEMATGLPDFYRHEFLMGNMGELLRVIHEDKVRVTGYTYWSLMDNFEWQYGYTKRYGLNFVDFNNPDRPRIPRVSSLTYAYITHNKTLKGLRETIRFN